jgi:AraC-like DNA-binding protein
VLDKVFQEDIVKIISSQAQLIDRLEESFPSIKSLSAAVNMSEIKYKSLFKKITGTTAKAFFMANKLDAAKEMLDTGNYTIAEVAHHFSFFDASHFIEQFKSRYKITPKEYVTLY